MRKICSTPFWPPPLKRLSFSALILMAPPAVGRCLVLPADEAEPIISVCEDKATYTFKKGDERHGYPKLGFQRHALNLMTSWLEGTSFPASQLCGSEFSIWLAAPETDLLTSQLRLVVINPHMPFVAFLPWEQASWERAPVNLAILPAEGYPDSFGYRSGSILVKKKPQVSSKSISSYVQAFGLHSPLLLGDDWLSFQLQGFGELSTLGELKNDLHFSFYGEDATLNPIFEWIATRSKAFSFFGVCPPAPSEEGGKLWKEKVTSPSGAQ